MWLCLCSASNNDVYNWEAHQVTTEDGYEKVLFRLTGKESDPEFKATKQPVLLVTGSTQNVMSWFAGDVQNYFMPNQGDIYFFELYLEEDLKKETIEASYLLSDYMRRSPIRYFQLTKEW